jgi:hypothetical protein
MFLDMSVRALKNSHPQAKIIGGAIAMMLSHKGMSFMEHAFEAGLGKLIDVFSFHIYRGTPEGGYERQVRAMRAIVAKHCPGVPIWQGESGAPSAPQTDQALSNYIWDEHKQAKWAARRTMLDLELDMTLTSWFHASDFDFYISQGKRTDKKYYYGLLDNGRRKASYNVYQTLCTLFAGETRLMPELNALVDEGTPPLAPPLHEPIRLASFLAEGRPLIAYWLATDTMSETKARPINLQFWSSTRAIQNPVLIDPMNQTVYRPSKVVLVDEYTTRIEGVPLVDFPLLVASEASISLRKD